MKIKTNSKPNLINYLIIIAIFSVSSCNTFEKCSNLEASHLELSQNYK